MDIPWEFPPLADICFVPVLPVASFAECHNASCPSPGHPQFLPSVGWVVHLHGQPLGSTVESSALCVTRLDFRLAELRLLEHCTQDYEGYQRLAVAKVGGVAHHSRAVVRLDL